MILFSQTDDHLMITVIKPYRLKYFKNILTFQV